MGPLLRGETIDRRARTGRIGGPKIPAGIMELGNSVWEDEGTLHWKLRIAKDVEVPGGTSIQVDAFVKGPQPQVQQLVVVELLQCYEQY